MTNYECPKCRGEMSSYERNGVVVEQCRDCRGLFLDRGELEKLISAETSWQSQAPSRPAAPTSGYTQHKRKRSFLEELFD